MSLVLLFYHRPPLAVARTAAAADAAVVTSDAEDISQLPDALGAPLPVLAP